MKKLLTLLKCASALLGVIIICTSVTYTSSTIWQRIEGVLAGLAFILAAFLALPRHLLLTYLGFMFALIEVRSIIDRSSNAVVMSVLIVTCSLALCLYSGYKAYRIIRGSTLVSKLFSKAQRAKAANSPPINAEPIREYFTKVVGVTFQNDDGTDRQDILSRCNKWDEITLKPFTYRGDPAYAVWTPHGQIGNLSADDAAMIAGMYADFITLAEIKEITGGTLGCYYGCNLTLTVYSKNDQLSPLPDPPAPNEPAPTVNYDGLSDRELLPLAVDVVLETGQASVSILQRRLKLGYARCARLIDEMEDRGFISPFNSNEPRIIMITRAGWEYMRSEDSGASPAVPPAASPPASPPAREVSDVFIAEAQWYAARGGEDLIDDE